MNSTISRQVWLSARARNAMRRPVFIGGVSAGVFVTTLVALVVAPQQERRVRAAQAAAAASAPARADTLRLVEAINEMGRRVASAESSLVQTRQRAAVTMNARASIDTLDTKVVARRDSLTAILGELQSLLATAETAPLATSYRALAASRALTSNARAKALVDSLGDIERERDALGAAGGADPIFVALTSRLTEIGREIQTQGEARRDALRSEIELAATPNPRRAAVASASADTLPWVAERDSARSAVKLAEEDLVAARNRLSSEDAARARTVAAASGIAPPYALLGAAIVFGLVLGFGAAFVSEARQPRVADSAEVEAITGLRVLATIRPSPPAPERSRREADRTAPPYFHPALDGHQLAYLQVARPGAARTMLTVVSDDTAIAGVVAANLAAIAADEARSTILVDTDVERSPVAGALRVRPAPGLADILSGRAGWADASATTKIGRDRSIDIVPGGAGAASPESITELFRRDGPRLARHYEAVVIVATMHQAKAGLPSALPAHDTIVCIQTSRTRLAELVTSTVALRDGGANVLGIVIWDAEAPSFPAPEPNAPVPRLPARDNGGALVGAG